MAISMGGRKIGYKKKVAAEKLAAAQAAAAKKEKKRKGFAGALGKLASVAATATLGPLGGALVSWGSKKLIDEGTKKLGMGATKSDVAAIKGDTQYGFAEKEAEQAKKGISEMRKTDWSLSGLGAELAAGAAGHLAGGKAAKDFLKLGKGSGTFGLGAAAEAAGGGDMSFGEAFKAARGKQGAGGKFSWQGKEYTTDYAAEGGFISKYENGGEVQPETLGENLIQGYQGSQAPPPLTGDQLFHFIQSQTPQQEESNVPTIADYFTGQGRTLSGNSTQSISQLLGR